MNDLLGNNYEPTEDQLKIKKLMKIIGVVLVLLLIVCIVLIFFMKKIENEQLKITLDGKSTTSLEKILLFEDEKIYVPIRKFAEYVGYEDYGGDYKQYAEDNTKCYVQSNYEIASFTMNSDKIYKLLVNGTDYEYFTINEPVKMINNELYTTTDGIERAFNITFEYDKEKNKITIYTLPYLVNYWASRITNSAIAGEGTSFSNQKAILDGRIIVKNASNYYGVSDLNGNEILGTKYASIQYIESTREFIVTTAEKKMGIMSYDASTKISPNYDDIKQIDKDAGLYLVTNNKKQGVINGSGSTVIYLEYDQIGIDSSRYTTNNIKNQYLLYDNCIPVKLNGMWGMFDKTGRQMLKVEYQEFGCTAGNAGVNQGSEALKANNLLLIPEYKGIIIKKDGMYGAIDSNGNELLPIVLDSIYSTVTSGEETYYMVYQKNQLINVIDYISRNNPQANQNQNNANNQQNSNNQTNAENTNNTVDTTNTNVESTNNAGDATNANAENNGQQVNNNNVQNTVDTNANVEQTNAQV